VSDTADCGPARRLAAVSGIASVDVESVDPADAVGVVVDIVAAADGLSAGTGERRSAVRKRRSDGQGRKGQKRQKGRAGGKSHGGFWMCCAV
jgi:hypothetical protein